MLFDEKNLVHDNWFARECFAHYNFFQFVHIKDHELLLDVAIETL